MGHRKTRAGCFTIEGWAIARHVKVESPERLCLSCGARIGRLSTIAYALIGGLCESCDHEVTA